MNDRFTLAEGYARTIIDELAPADKDVAIYSRIVAQTALQDAYLAGYFAGYSAKKPNDV